MRAIQRAALFSGIGVAVLGLALFAGQAFGYGPGSTFQGDPLFCNNPVQSSVIVDNNDGGPTFVPSVNSQQRISVAICNDQENDGGLLKCGLGANLMVDAGIQLGDSGIQLIMVNDQPVITDAGIQIILDNPFDAGITLVDAGIQLCWYTPYTAYYSGSGETFTADGGPCGYGQIGYDAGIQVINGVDSGILDPADGGPSPDAGILIFDAGITLGDGGPSDAGILIVTTDGGNYQTDAGIQLFDAGVAFKDAGFVFLDGGPFIGNQYPGDSLPVGSCISYPVGSGTQAICIDNVTGAAAAVTECH